MSANSVNNRTNINSFILLKRTEYSEKQSISKLIGSPPGYVGHDEGGALTEAVRRRPHAVILLDEIEKADKEVMNILLQISDYGYLTDSSGRHVNFRNAIIIATANSGGSHSTGSVGFETRKNKGTDTDISILKKYYGDELINRFDEIITFKPLSDETLLKIVLKRLSELEKSLSKKGYSLIYAPDIAKTIVHSGKLKGLGARAVLRKISSEIEAEIINIICLCKEKAEIEITSELGEIKILTKKP